MTPYQRGDIALCADGRGDYTSKPRPVVIVHQWQIQKVPIDTEPTERQAAKRPSGRICGAAALEFC